MKLINIEFEDIDHKDAPDYSDVYISYAEYVDGQALTQEELDNIPSDVVYEYLLEHLY